jgi:cytochrome c
MTPRVPALALLGAVLGLAVLASAGLPAGDPTRGAAVFRQCAACHAVEPGLHLTGPSLARIWGHRAGTVEGFTRYSPGLRGADIVWTDEMLDRWLERPAALIPDNAMTFPGIADPQQRADLIAYLKALGTGRAAAPPGGMMSPGARPDLETLGPDRRVRAIRYCPDAYHVTTERGETLVYWEFNLRFKTDSSPLGPAPGTPVLVPAGMMGDRAQVVFATPEEISRTIVRRCEGVAP